MRLIDADAFCGFLREVSTRQHYETLLTKKDRYPTVADVIEEICCDLDGTSLNGFDNAPTIEPTTVYEFKGCDNCELERPKGKWIRTGSVGNGNAHYECSNCHYGDEHAESQKVPYCWHCGARMER